MRSTSTASDIGEPGETVTINVELHSEDFDYIPVANEVFHYFEPNKVVPVSVVGEATGAYPNVSPINRFVALESSDDTDAPDQIGLDVGAGQGVTSLFTYFCEEESCFDGDVTPFTSEELFDISEKAITRPDDWSLSSASTAVFAGPNNDLVTFGVVDWTLTDLDTVTSLSITPTVDVQLTPGSTFTIEEGASSIYVDAGTPFIPREDALLEFPLEDVPAGATISSATLALDGVASTSSVTIEVDGYAGDGLAATADASATTTEIGQSEPISAIDEIELQLDAAYIQSLLGTTSHLGLRLSSVLPSEYVQFRSSESVLGDPPTLTLNFEGGSQGGDFNGDGLVDARDYAAWRDGLGATYAAAQYQEWRDGYGPPSPLDAQHVPEPHALLLLSAAACSVSAAYRPRAKRRV